MRQKHIQYTCGALFMQYKFVSNVVQLSGARDAGKPAREVCSSTPTELAGTRNKGIRQMNKS